MSLSLRTCVIFLLHTCVILLPDLCADSFFFWSSLQISGNSPGFPQKRQGFLQIILVPRKDAALQGTFDVCADFFFFFAQ